MAVVAMLRVAPVKGLATVPTQRIALGADGVAEDRRVLLLDERGAVMTLSKHPQLVQVVPDLDLRGGWLRITLPDGGVAASRLDEVAAPAEAVLYGKQRRGRLLPGDVAAALSDAAGQPVRVLLAERAGVGWDEGPVSLFGRASAVAVAGRGRDVARFRMLVELEGTEAFEEDGWIGREVALGGAVIRITNKLQRCVIITQSPATGAKDWDGLHALTAMGRDDLCLGVIAEVLAAGEVEVGAQAQVLDGSAAT